MVFFPLVLLLCLLLFIQDPYITNDELANNMPSLTHLFGTDFLGRDVLSRCLYGLYYSFLITIIALAVVLIVGITVGVICSVGPKWLGDKIILFLDFMNSFPSIIYTLIVASLFEPTLLSLGIIIGCCSWMTLARQVRMLLLKETQQPYVYMAKQIGTSKWHRFTFYYLPALAPVISVTVVQEAIHVLFTEATLSFLGFGLSINIPTLGSLLIDAQNYFLLNSWWNVLFPGIMVLLATSCLFFLKKKLLLREETSAIY